LCRYPVAYGTIDALQRTLVRDYYCMRRCVKREV
jgi:hypothetical protein